MVAMVISDVITKCIKWKISVTAYNFEELSLLNKKRYFLILLHVFL